MGCKCCAMQHTVIGADHARPLPGQWSAMKANICHDAYSAPKVLYRILAIQQTQVPSDAVPLGTELALTSGTTITVMEDSVIKRVDLSKQLHLIDQLAALQQLYKATKGSKYLIQSEDGPHIRTTYTVTLFSYGDQLGSGSVAVYIT